MVTLQQLQVAAPVPSRWPLYRDILDGSLTALNQTAGALPIAARALNDVALFQPLLEALDTTAAVGVAQDLAELRSWVIDSDREAPTRGQLDAFVMRYLAGPTPPKPRSPADAYTWYITHFIEVEFPVNGAQPIRGRDLFLRRFPLTHHYLTRIAGQFCHNLGETIVRVNTDREILIRLFFPGATDLEIRTIKSSGADTHKGGKQVLFLTFDLQNAQGAPPTRGELVYKPSDVELDYRICGDSAALTAASNQHNPIGPEQGLVERVNRYIANEAERLPTYRILPRFPGSQLEEEGGALPIARSYGYIEFLSSNPPRQSNGLFDDRATDRDVAASDWLCANKQELAAFFRTWGRWMALARLFSWGDLHEENVIAHRKRPWPIDFEISCTGPMTSLRGTQIVQRAFNGGLDGDRPVHPPMRPFPDQTSNMRFNLEGLSGQRSPALNRVAVRTDSWWPFRTRDGWRRVFGVDNLTPIIAGMRSTYQIVAAHPADFVEWNTAVRRCIARFTPYGTGPYTKALRGMAYSPENTRRQPPIAEHDNLAEWQAVVNPLLGPVDPALWPTNRPNRFLSAYQHDYADFANHDVPAYYHRLDSPQLLNARGQTVVIPNEAPHGRDTYFPEPTIASAEAQLAALTGPAQNGQRVSEQLADAITLISGDTEGTRARRLIAALLPEARR